MRPSWWRSCRQGARLFKEARSQLSTAPFVSETDTYDQAGKHVKATVVTDTHRDATASWQVGSGTDDVVQVGGRQWERPNRAYLADQGQNDLYAQKVLPDHWEIVHSPETLERESVTLVGGVSASNPARFIRASDRSNSGAPSNIVTDFSYPAGAHFTAPTNFYDPDNPATLPSRYRVTRQDASCTERACQFTVSVTNDYGAPVGQSSITVHVYRTGGAEVTSCSAPVPSVPHNGSEDVTCSVSGPDWTAFYTGASDFDYQATVSDPLWGDG